MSEGRRKIRVAHLVNYLGPAGKETGIVKLLNALDAERYAPYLIVFDKVFDALTLDTDKTVLHALNKKPGNDPSLIYKLARYFREHKIDIVHTHSWGTLVEGVLAARLAGVPKIIHGEHGTFPKGFPHRTIQNIFFRRCDQVLSVSGELADKLAEVTGYPRAKIKTIYNGVDTAVFHRDAEMRRQYRQENLNNPDTLWIGTVGRTVKVKNQQLLVRAAQQLKKEKRSFLITIVGDSRLNSLRPQLEKLAQDLDVKEHIQFAGIRKDVAGFLNGFDIFALPSLSEGCSNVIQEAMTCGLPVVASRVGGNPELVNHEQTGILFESDNVEQLSAALGRLIDEPEFRKKMSQGAAQHAAGHFALEKMKENYQDVYEKVYGSGK